MFGSVKDNEANKFRQSGLLSKVAVTLEDGLLAGVTYTKILVEYPTPITELYKYYNGASLEGQVLLTYTSSTKADLSSAERL